MSQDLPSDNCTHEFPQLQDRLPVTTFHNVLRNLSSCSRKQENLWSYRHHVVRRPFLPEQVQHGIQGWKSSVDLWVVSSDILSVSRWFDSQDHHHPCNTNTNINKPSNFRISRIKNISSVFSPMLTVTRVVKMVVLMLSSAIPMEK